MKKLLVLALLIGCSQPKEKQQIKEISLGVILEDEYPKYLSLWNLFIPTKDYLVENSDVFSYDLNAPLFSDYAHKARFIKLPEGTEMSYHDEEVFGFPEGAILVKHFYYPSDFRKSEGERRIIETRLLIKKEIEWDAIVYQWNADQTDAERVVLGAEVPVEWKDEKGKLQRINYSIPSQPQCKSCHELNGKMSPIGPSARQLNIDDQLQKWGVKSRLDSLPNSLPKLANYLDGKEDLKDRARAWLEINCAHCHRREGPAKNTGLYLLASEEDDYRIGVNKAPIAAGRGSGGHKYSIVPGHPDQSILVHRIETLELGEMMPELGRKMKHQEGVELIRSWIESME